MTLDHDETLILPAQQYALMHIAQGSSLSRARLKELKKIEELYRAEQTGLKLLERRSCTIAQLASRLDEELYSQETIDQVVQKFRSLGLVNDESFAERWISSQLAKKPVGRRYLFHGLLRKGLKRDVIEKALAEAYSSEVEQDYCRKLMEKLIDRKGGDLRRIVPALERRGFSIPVIQKLVRQFKQKK